MNPALTAIQIALCDLLRSLGVRPDAVLGLSGGEFAAAYAAGGLSAEDAMELACSMSLVIRQRLGTGKMVLIRADAAQAEVLIRSAPDPTYLVAEIGPRSFTLATTEVMADGLMRFLRSSGIEHYQLPWEFGYHSPLMDPWAIPLRQALTNAGVRVPTTTVYSAASGGIQRILDGAHWCSTVREPALFATAARAAIEDGFDRFLEVNIHPALSDAIQELATAMDKNVVVLPVMRDDQPATSVIQSSLTTLSASL